MFLVKAGHEPDQPMNEIILHNNRNQNSSLQLLLLALALMVCVFLAVVINVHYGFDIVYTHLFYIPIILAGVWYHRWALLVAGGLGVVHISCDYVINHGLTSSSLLRTGMFLAVALVVGLLSENRDLLYQELRKINNAIKETEFKYRTVADYAYDWETWEDETGKLNHISPACERTSGYTVNEFLENKSLFASLILAEDQER
jgi:PAS domain-containing protein